MGLQGVDLHARMVTTEADPIACFGTMNHDTQTLASVAERDLWLNTSDQDDLLGVNDASMFYAEFPPLPDFPCMSSSSSSSSTPAVPLKTITCSTTTTTTSSSSSSASWAVLKPDAAEDVERNENNCNNNLYMQHQNDPLDAATTPAGVLSSTASMEISQQQHPDQHGFDGVGDCMEDVMDTFGYMELLEANDFFDPSSIFQDEDNPLGEFTQEQVVPQQEEQQHQHAIVANQQELITPQQGAAEEGNHHHQVLGVCDTANNEVEIQGEEGGGVGDSAGAGADDEMSMVFLEWLKSNKDSVSASDLRSVKLKKTTIESAARRLGGGKEAMKQLLKLILEWVQTSHLQNKRRKENNNNNNNNNNTPSNPLTQFQDPDTNTGSNLNSNGSFGSEPNTCFNQTPWMSPPPPYGTDQAPLMGAPPPPPFPQPMVGYVGDPYTSGATTKNINVGPNHSTFQPATDYHMLESANSWPPSQFTLAPHYNQPFGDNGLHVPGPPVAAFGGYGNQYPYQFFHGPGDGLMRLGPSATREARKKRMARQRRISSHPRHHSHHQNQGSDTHARLEGDNCTSVVAAAHANPANWVYWPTMASGAASMAPLAPAEPPAGPPVVDRTAMQTQNYHQVRVPSDRRQVGGP